MADVPFNGGKMNHIFKPGRGRYEEAFSCKAAQRCFEDPESVATLKVHGECCLLVKTPVSNGENPGQQRSEATKAYEWIFHTRLDTRGKPFPEGHVPVPPQVGETTLQPATFENHTYCFVPLPKHLVTGKSGKKSKKSRPGPDTYDAIQAGILSGDLPDPNDEGSPSFVSVEWVGRKHQGNIDCLDVDHALTVHGSTVVEIGRTREAVEQMAKEVSIEGVVFQDRESGERFKLLFQMLPDSLFAENSQKKVSTPESTSIKPKVIQAESAAA